MYLHKVYNAFYRVRCLEILEGYGMVPQARHILREYWENFRVVDRAGGYYGVVFKSFRGVTQGELLSPTIFNVVVDAVVHHWVSLVEGGAGVQEGWGR